MWVCFLVEYLCTELYHYRCWSSVCESESNENILIKRKNDAIQTALKNETKWALK